VLIAGNAAHRHPPANGLGTNTCIQDGLNLAWKLALVLKGQAGVGLLDTYTQERQPVAQQVVDRAMKSVGDMLPISKALGFEPGQDEAAGWANVDNLFEDTAHGRARRQALRDAVDLQNYQFNCHGVEMGQIYTSSAVVPTARRGRLRRATLSCTTTRARSPARICRMRGSSAATNACRRSTWWAMDASRCSPAWAARRGVRSRHRSPRRWALPSTSPPIGGPKCDAQDVHGRWADLAGISESGCLLVRPDRHIAWRQQDSAGASQEALEKVMCGVLDRPRVS